MGIKLAKSVSSLYQVNYTLFLCNLPEELEIISKLTLSWSGRLAAFKRLKLPQLLNQFKLLPIPVPLSLFTSLKMTLGQFVWQNLKARSSWSILMKRRSLGSAGYIKFKDYYNATILAKQRLVNFLVHGTTLNPHRLLVIT